MRFRTSYRSPISDLFCRTPLSYQRPTISASLERLILRSNINLRPFSTSKLRFGRSNITHDLGRNQPIGLHKVLGVLQTRKMSSSASPAEATCDAKEDNFDEWNRCADHMNYFHNIFRQKWTIMHTALENKQRPRNMTQNMFMNFALEFCRGLTMHHNIEEAHVFPMLATRMPAFKDQAEMKEHHKKIHAGLDLFEEYAKDVKAGRKEFDAEKMLSLMDAFGDVLWTHLDEEVKQLGAENMKKYWKLEELKWIM